MYEIIFYATPDGKCPVQEFLNTLDSKLLAKMLRMIDLLKADYERRYGNEQL